MFTRGMESLVEPAVQLMRKCYPKCPLPLTSALSAHIFPLPGRPLGTWDFIPGAQGDVLLSQEFFPPKTYQKNGICYGVT